VRDRLVVLLLSRRIWTAVDRSCARLADGSTQCKRDLAQPIDLGKDVLSVAFGVLEVCYVRKAGTVACRRDDEATARDVAGITGATAIARVFTDYCAMLRDGSVLCWNAQSPPALIAGVTDAVELVSNDKVGCVRRDGGTVVCWGAYNGVGNGSHETTDTPVVIPLP
jgi:hypothetical protein